MMEPVRTRSLCPVCLKKLDGEISIKDGVVIVSRECADHGIFECPHAWDDPYMYENMLRISDAWLNPPIKDMTIDVTDKCNMNCPFCFNTAKKEPVIEDIIGKAGMWGGGNILLYGGEPTMREDLPDIVRSLKERGFGVILLSNGLLLDETLSRKLDEAGLDGVLLQLDSMDDGINERMRGMRLLDVKRKAMKSLEGTSIWLSFFVVIVKDLNESQVKPILELAGEMSDGMRTVLFCPISPEGAAGFDRKFVRNDDIFSRISELGITKDDFISNTMFDVTLTSFLSRVRVDRKGIALCEAVCYAHVREGVFTPLNRMLDLEGMTTALNESNSFPSLFLNIMKRRILFDSRLIPIMVRLSASFLNAILFGGKFKDNVPGMIGIVVNPSQTRYNADYNLIDTCNLYSDSERGTLTFCENNIFSTGRKRLEDLDMDHIYSMNDGG
ncbi:MAG: radical SAM protein [Candidatus Altiarchaeota archaeon]